ncbi:hypothetical protein BH23GEM10_BH23GEM10_02630 [soil metagenome]
MSRKSEVQTSASPRQGGGTRNIAGSRRIAWLLDDVFRVPGTRLRFGLDPVLGLLPGAGDLFGGGLSAWIVITAARLGASPAVLLRMGGNIALDVIVGTVPLVGDLFDAGWKANRRNLALLERYAAEPAPVTRRSRIMLVAVLAGLTILLLVVAALVVSLVRAIAGSL